MKLFLALLLLAAPLAEAARCVGAVPCRACVNCRSCRHCAAARTGKPDWREPRFCGTCTVPIAFKPFHP